MHCSACNERYRSRAIDGDKKSADDAGDRDNNEAMRLAAAGAAADLDLRRDRAEALRQRLETEVAADLAALLREFGHGQVDFTVVGSGPNGANRTTRLGIG